jgi:hypothetical protein
LRYLGLCSAHIFELPEEIGNLQFLQTLDLRYNDLYSSLPLSVVQLRNLIYLDIDSHTTLPNGIVVNLTCLEYLSWLCINDSTINILDELGHLTELRQLGIALYKWNTKLLDCIWNSKLLDCTNKLQKIQELDIMLMCGYPIVGGLDAWVAPASLQVLRTQRSYCFSTLPACVNPSLLLDLTELAISVKELHQVDLEILGRLPSLLSLKLKVDSYNGGFMVGAGAFLCLVRCYFSGYVWPVVFQQGAMPRPRELRLSWFLVPEARGGPINIGQKPGRLIMFGKKFNRYCTFIAKGQ